MKHGKVLKRWMKVLLSSKGFNSDDWLFTKNTPTKLEIVHKISGEKQTFKKEVDK